MMNIPKALIFSRLVMAPVILGLAGFAGESSRYLILALMYAGLVSDVFDGIIARKLNISSARLRRMDSQVDMVFWVSIGIATWLLHPQLIDENSYAIAAIFVMEMACYLISYVKFGRETSTHAFLSKIWGISLLLAFTSLIGFNHAGMLFYAAIVIGIISQLDVMLIVLILPKWTHDIPSAYHAWLIRRGIPFRRNKLLNG
jgi:phosphatidylglycerophosphate synthase